LSARRLAKPVKQQPSKRRGRPTAAEKDFVAQLVMDNPGPMTKSQTDALARVLRRPKEVTLNLIEQARENFQARAGSYVDMHHQAVQTALANGDPKSLEVATRGSQWAIEKISGEGARIVESGPAQVGPGGPRVMIGIKIGQSDEHKVIAQVEQDE
jgi:hypothetical protein